MQGFGGLDGSQKCVHIFRLLKPISRYSKCIGHRLMQVKPTFSLSSSFFSHLTTRLIGFSFQRVISWPFPPGCISSSLLHIWTHFVWIFIKLTCSPFLPMVWAVGPLCHLLYVWSLYLLHETYNTLYISLRISWIFLLSVHALLHVCSSICLHATDRKHIYLILFFLPVYFSRPMLLCFHSPWISYLQTET